MIGMGAARKGTSSAARPKASSAGLMNGVWKAPATARRFTAQPSGGALVSRSMAFSDPAATTCPVPLRLATDAPAAPMASATTAGSPPRTAAIVVSAALQASAMANPRRRANRTASPGSSTPAIAAADSSPTE